MRLTDRSAHPIKTYLLSSLRVLMHVNYINLTVYSVAKTDHYKFGRASSLDETQWNRGNRSAVKPRFRLATSRLQASNLGYANSFIVCQPLPD